MTSTIETEDVVEAVARALTRTEVDDGLMSEISIGLYVDKRWREKTVAAEAALSATPIERLREENARRGEALQTIADRGGAWAAFAREAVA